MRYFWVIMKSVSPLLLAALLLTGCQSAYYNTMEKVGYHKRDILVERVSKARDAQQEGKEQFQSALERFSNVLDFKGGKLEEKYKKLNDEYEASEDKADQVRDRIDAVEDVAEALFEEWEEELGQYTSATLKRDSERKLQQTRSRYKKLIAAMQQAEKKMDPVLNAFKDQVLYLKHNLNAKAIISLQKEFKSVKSNIAALVKDMERSISEADAFIKDIGTQ
ncbi:ATPase involved in DNA repair [hydrothermal vent metagenome]|uniref:ATPase involved in DNA repair n=1 Tax=hydrothermal vent metagenome TaxID=652676 RepID=A0A3B1B5M5_9ZZZZ